MIGPFYRKPWLPAAATALAALSCYGTTALIAVLSALGVSLAFDERIWAGAISFFAAVAAVTIAASFPRRRAMGPPIAAAIGLGLILWAMYGSYSRIAELGGFTCLAGAAVWDWRLRKSGRGMLANPAWIEPGALAERLKREADTIVVDVRGPEEFDGDLGHLPHARNIPFDALPRRLHELKPFADRGVVLVCRTQMRSAKAASVLGAAGFAGVTILRGGMEEWNRRRLPVERGTTSAASGSA